VVTEAVKKKVTELVPVLVGPSWDAHLPGMQIQYLFDPLTYVQSENKEKLKKGVFPEVLLGSLKKVSVINEFIEGQDCSLPRLTECAKLYLSSLIISDDGIVSETKPIEMILSKTEDEGQQPEEAMNTYSAVLSNRMLERVIKQVAVKEKRNGDAKPKWYLQ
jgi:hypothetical protein